MHFLEEEYIRVVRKVVRKKRVRNLLPRKVSRSTNSSSKKIPPRFIKEFSLRSIMSTNTEKAENYIYQYTYSEGMGSRTIMIRDDAYELLKSKKRADESFTDVIIRLGNPPKKKLTDCIGLWADIPKEDLERIERNILNLRKGSTKALLKKWEN